jgi:hypothetical protein
MKNQYLKKKVLICVTSQAKKSEMTPHTWRPRIWRRAVWSGPWHTSGNADTWVRRTAEWWSAEEARRNSEKNRPQCHFIHHESLMNQKLGGEKIASGRLSRGYRKFSSTVDYLDLLKVKISFISVWWTSVLSIVYPWGIQWKDRRPDGTHTLPERINLALVKERRPYRMKPENGKTR